MKIILLLCFLASILLQGNDTAPAPEEGYRSLVFDKPIPFQFDKPNRVVGSDDGNFGGNVGTKYLLVDIDPE